MSRPDIDKIRQRLAQGRAQNPDDVEKLIAEVPAWSKTPPAYKENVKPCHFLTGGWMGDVFEFDVWEIQWSESDNYWMLLNGDGEEWGCIRDDFPQADYYMVLPSPPKENPDA